MWSVQEMLEASSGHVHEQFYKELIANDPEVKQQGKEADESKAVKPAEEAASTSDRAHEQEQRVVQRTERSPECSVVVSG